MAVTAEPFGRNELRAMQALARRVWDADPSLCNGDASIGELAWSWASAIPERRARWNLRLLPALGELRGWGWSTGPETIRVSEDSFEQQHASLLWQLGPGETGMLGPLLDWFDQVTDGVPRMTRVRSHDAGSVAVLEEHGYVRDDEAPWTMLLTRPLANVETRVLPPGYRLTSMAEFGDLEARVEVHRAAWHPSKQTVDTYTNVTHTWPYRPDLDVVVVAPDGSLAASVLVWYEPGTSTGELEPVGTHPAHRQLGLAAAASLFAAGRLAELGATQAAVSCRGDDAYPIPRRLYESVGFVGIARDWVFRKSE